MVHAYKLNAIKKIAAVFVIGFLPFLQSGNLFAQGFQAEIGAQLGLARAELADNISNAGFGLAANFGYNFGRLPLLLGLETSALNFGQRNRQEVIGGNAFAFQTRTRVNLIHGVFRVQSNGGLIRPFVDGLLGVSIFATSANTIVNGFNQASVFVDDIAFSTGVGGGIMIRLRKGRRPGSVGPTNRPTTALKYASTRKRGGRRRRNRSNGSRTEILLDMRVRYIFGGNAEYLTEETVDVNGNNFIFEVIESRTDLLIPRIGVTFIF